MREIKGPRVWDDVLGKMLYSKFEQYDDSIGFRFSEHLETENPVYMWPTGLRDKNGKEIYEGDILRMDDGVKNQFVKWSDWMAGFVMMLSDTSDSTDIPSNCEVIGNIYENPELLK